MKVSTPSTWAAFSAAFVLSCVALPCSAQSIYKCHGPKGIVYTDHPCAGHGGKVLYQANDSDVIDHYLDLGQIALAKHYAHAHQLDTLYASRLQAYQKRKDAEREQQARAFLAAEQHEQEVRRQAVAERRARQAQLEAENVALREQNDQYQDELAQPVGSYANSGYLIDTSHRHVYHMPSQAGHHDHTPASPPRPVYHPCTQLAGERTIC